MKQLSIFLCAAIVWSALSMTTISTSSVFAQQKEESPNVLKVYPLKFLDAESAVQILERMLEPELVPTANLPTRDGAVKAKTGLVAETRTNSIVANGSADFQNKLVVILQVLDVATKADTRQPTVIQTHSGSILKNEGFLQKAAELWDVQVAYESDLDLLMVKGDAEKVKVFQDMLKSLDTRSDAVDSGGTIRIVWLATQSRLVGEAKPLTPELERATAKLKELGIDNLGVACQLLAHSESSEFEVSGSANFKDSAIALKVEGNVVATSPGTYKFHFAGADINDVEVCQLTISARLAPGRVIVLASAPFKTGDQEIQSVFVVQLLQGL